MPLLLTKEFWIILGFLLRFYNNCYASCTDFVLSTWYTLANRCFSMRQQLNGVIRPSSYLTVKLIAVLSFVTQFWMVIQYHWVIIIIMMRKIPVMILLFKCWCCYFQLVSGLSSECSLLLFFLFLGASIKSFTINDVFQHNRTFTVIFFYFKARWSSLPISGQATGSLRSVHGYFSMIFFVCLSINY